MKLLKKLLTRKKPKQPEPFFEWVETPEEKQDWSTKKAQVRACANNDRGSLAFEAGFIAELRSALILPLGSYEEQKNNIDKLAEAFDCEVLIVEAEYNVTKLDGSDFERTEREESMEDRNGALLNLLTN